MTMKSIKLLIVISISIFLFSCGESLPIDDDLSDKSYSLLNQDSVAVDYPSNVKSKIAVVGYVFTNCPDICPLTTNNMRLVQEKINEEGITGVEFVTITFDPEYDTPSVLKEYAEVRRLDTSNWMFLTGDKAITDEVMKDAGVVAVPSDSTLMESGNMMYFFVHTDRIHLLDQQNRIRGTYLGSQADINKLVNDIKILAN
ncbi:MAG: SCO family protein [Ignavibacteriales bacterium]|nr:MAG: SCO family protein [Ignavibacteriales bacterium]